MGLGFLGLNLPSSLLEFTSSNGGAQLQACIGRGRRAITPASCSFTSLGLSRLGSALAYWFARWKHRWNVRKLAGGGDREGARTSAHDRVQLWQ